MKTQELDHVLRAIGKDSERDYCFLLMGSQAILAHMDSDHFPELVNSDILLISQEIDVALMDENESLQEEVATRIDAVFGKLSQFDQTFGYYADGVEVKTATLAGGWKDRLVPYHSNGVPVNKFWALSYADLIVSKIMAGRPKDIDYVRSLRQVQPFHPHLRDVEGLLASLPESPNRDLAIQRWKAIYEPQASAAISFKSVRP